MNWKLSTTVLCVFSAAMPAAAWQAPAQAYEVAATPKGNFVAWPAGMFEKADVLAFAEKAEADLSATGRVAQGAIGELETDVSSTGRVSQGAVAELTIKTKSSPPRMAAPRPQRQIQGAVVGGRDTHNGGGASSGTPPQPDQGLSATVVRVAFGAAAAGCAGGAKGCFDSSGRPCQEGQPGCRCGCARPVGEGPAASEAFRQKREGIPMIVIAPSPAESAAAVGAALHALAHNGFNYKIESQ